MRELPEFQILSTQLDALFNAKVLTRIGVIDSKKIKEKPQGLNKLKGSALKSIQRSGKALDFIFSDGNILQFDLKLHGCLEVFKKNNEHKHTLLELYFDNERGIALTDILGHANITLNPAPSTAIDALSKDVYSRLVLSLQSKAKIKGLLTNQKIIKGIGSVYADEILWEARISPFSVSSAIPEFKIKGLANAIKTVLLNAETQIINKKVTLFHSEGYDFLSIFGKEGERSPGGSIIKLDKKAGHSTYYTQEQVLYS